MYSHLFNWKLPHINSKKLSVILWSGCSLRTYKNSLKNMKLKNEMLTKLEVLLTLWVGACRKPAWLECARPLGLEVLHLLKTFTASKVITKRCGGIKLIYNTENIT